jgi:ethanolamine ammonia-lyase large subunit
VPSPNRGSFARTVCVVREVDAIPLELYRQFLDRVVARFEFPTVTCVLAHLRLNMVAVLPVSGLIHGWFTTVAPG